MAKIVIACNKKPLAAFIEAELGGLVDCRIADDAAHLLTLMTEFKPDALLFEAEFPTLAESPTLLSSLRTENPQIQIVGVFEPFAENRGEIESSFSPENILQLPFGGDELSEKLQQVAGLDIKNRIVSLKKEGEEEMGKPQSSMVETVVLTEIVEEGLPLDELPEIIEGGAPEILPAVDPVPAETVVLEPEGEPVDDFESEDFGDTLDDLESISEEPANAGSDTVIESDVEVESEPEPGPEVVSEVEDNSSELIDGDTDALLADEDFTEIEISENYDPVLAELKSAGLTPEDEVITASTDEDSVSPTPELEGGDDFGKEELGDIDDLLDEESVSAQSNDPAYSSLAAAVVAEEILTADSPDAEVELPEDYLVDEAVLTGRVEPEVEVKSAPEPAAQSLSAASPLKLDLGEPEVCAEPITPDFSRQIESMTQEWSKQLLHTTYASMDKMIKAIGDMAPTIVEQVAREVIPQLAEKVIKAEIARLEENLEDDEEQEEISNS